MAMDTLTTVATLAGFVIYAVGGPVLAIASALAWQLRYRALAFVFGFLCLTLLMQLYGLSLIAAGTQSMAAWLMNRVFQAGLIVSVVWSCVWMWRQFVASTRAAGTLPGKIDRALHKLKLSEVRNE